MWVWSTALAALMVTAVPALGQIPSPIDAATTIAAVRRTIAENYVVADQRAGLDAALVKGLKEGRYDALDPAALADRVTIDLVGTAHDKHLGLSHNPDLATRLGMQGKDDEAGDNYFRELARTQNHGIKELRVLEGNVRYANIESFMWTGAESGAAIDAAMAFLKGGDAAIIDLRRNGGGDPEAVARLTSWFVPGGTKLITFYMRQAVPTVTTTPTLRPGSMGDIPVYVLIGPRSASAAEEFASHVARLGFATLVGETTAGAAYRNEFFAIPGGYVLSVSIGRPELPGGGDWEGKGVAPKIAVQQDRALDQAQAMALAIIGKKAGGSRKAELEWAQASHAARAEPVAVTRTLSEYVGSWGDRTVELAGDQLLYHRGRGARTIMIPLSDDIFALESDLRTRIRYLPSGAIAIERVDGAKQEVPKS